MEGFSGMQRFWDPESSVWMTKILPGEYYVTRHNEAITTVLGSCISACVRDPLRNIGGMNHFMLPEENMTEAGASEHNSWMDPAVGLATRYGSHAMESLINNLITLGAARSRLEIKLFGGGRILTSMTDVGARNIAFIHHYAQLEGYPISAEDLGGLQPRKVVYFPSNGRVKVRRLPPIENRSIGDRERLYMADIRRMPDGGEVEIFEP